MEKLIKEFQISIRPINSELKTQLSHSHSDSRINELSHILGIQWLILWRLQRWGYFDSICPDFSAQL